MSENLKSPFWSDFLRFIVISALIIIPIRTWVAQPFLVRGASMEPTFEDGEYLIIDELSYRFREPQRGEVIVFRFPQDPSKFFIKRIIGLPDESIEIRENKIFIGGQELNEPYLSEALTTPDGIVELGAGEYFMLGDNRLFSSDSRKWGTLEQGLIVGRAWLRLWPPNRLNFLPGIYEFQG
ncbi:MAG: signal peptidase I [Patescibacteria group bacterium]